MKHLLLFLLAFLSLAPASFAGDKNKKAANDNQINWLTLDEVQVAMKEEPRKVFIDVYTDWCGWCKVMDKKTFSNPEVIGYINKHFYAVKLDAERKDMVRFMGKMYHFDETLKAHTLAAELMGGRMSYPTSVVLQEHFQNPTAIPGYLDVSVMEKVLRFFGEGHYKNTTFPEFEKTFVPKWAAK